MKRRFAISDIHGCNKTFGALLSRIEFSTDDELFILGDLIDRGPDSRGVIDRVWALQNRGFFIQCLKGNHEQMLLDSLRYHPEAVAWIGEGGSETLRSFSGHELSDIPDSYLEWIFDLPLYLETPGYLLVHAGVDCQHPQPLVDQQSLLWIRNWYKTLDIKWLGQRIIVHGHTPTDEFAIRQQLQNLADLPVVNIDNGCVFAPRLPQKPGGLGQLCAFELNEKQLFFQPYCE